MPHRRRARRPVRCALSVVCAVALAAGALATPVAASPPPSYAPPVDAAVLDPFRPPATPYGPGNRGLLYGTVPGTPVLASADGEVTFAGLVAGSRHVTVLHADGLRTSYSFLAQIDVVAGQRVDQGQVVGTAGERLHLGARSGDTYLDPAALFDRSAPRVHLVPFDDPPGNGEAGERSALRQLVGGLGGLGSRLGGEVAGTVGWLRGEGSQLLRTFGHYVTRFAPPMSVLTSLHAAQRAYVRARAVARRPCTAPEVTPRPRAERRMALLVAGLGSSSTDGAIDDVDTDALGYRRTHVLRFSYRGGRTPDPTDALATVESSSYGARDTQGDLREAGDRLADLLEDVSAAGEPVDLYAHSQGGLVARLALAELAERHGEGWLDRLGVVATLGTPHGGADLATGIHAVSTTRGGSAALDGVETVLGLELEHDAPSVAQLSETSDVVAELQDTPIPAGVRAVSIAARGDLVVPVPRTAVPGATGVVVPLVGAAAHDSLPGSADATRELALALAGLPPTCQAFGAALADQVVGEGISLGQDVLGALAWGGTASLGGIGLT